MATSYDPLGKDQDGQSNVPADVLEFNADFRRDLAFPTLTEDMVQRLQAYGREEIVPENVTLYTHGEPDSDVLAKTGWVTERYFIVPLGKTIERCLVCDFGGRNREKGTKK
jgi:hypothetical protein